MLNTSVSFLFTNSAQEECLSIVRVYLLHLWEDVRHSQLILPYKNQQDCTPKYSQLISNPTNSHVTNY